MGKDLNNILEEERNTYLEMRRIFENEVNDLKMKLEEKNSDLRVVSDRLCRILGPDSSTRSILGKLDVLL
jgi:hypothetical protein